MLIHAANRKILSNLYADSANVLEFALAVIEFFVYKTQQNRDCYIEEV